MDKLGQLMICGIKGTTLSPEEIDFIESENLGGIVLSSQNFQNPAQLAELVNSIQKLRDEYPLFMSVNHDGGKNSAFSTHFTKFPSMNDLARLNSPKLIFEVHEVMAKELHACGINLCFSPSCDILTNPENKVIFDSVYGTDVQSVEKFITASIRGFQTNGVLACAKHFPGMGNTSQDPHYDLPLIKTSMDVMKSRELIPFIKASKSRVEFMLMGHLLVDELDQKLPTSLAPKAYEFLRKETKFSKIVMTDNLEMKSITDRYSLEEAAVMAINAGADVIMLGSIDGARKAINSLREALKKRYLEREIVIEKLSRIEKCKSTHFQGYSPIYIPKIAESFNTNEAKALLSQIEALMTEKV